ncbi:OprD family porin [Pseudomonas sp. NPDC089734]|uniref:OprD family porin n=1 Tax=Pseudomonas sp. NPDC089734 TaxID=3364469 RepID=UPI003828F8CA
MSIAKFSLTTFLVSIGTVQTVSASDQSDSSGFVAGSKAAIKTRNFYMNRDNRASGAVQSYGEEWAQGFIGTFQSGFTQGTVGFGADAIGMFGVKLDTGRGRYGYGTNLMETDSSGPKDEYSKGGGVLKVRLSNTVLKYGTQVSTIPVAYTSDSRLLPETVTGTTITSKEIKNLTLDAGHLTGLTTKNQSTYDTARMTSVDYVGGAYKFSNWAPGLTGSLYYAKTDDYFKKYYVNGNYQFPLSGKQSIEIDLNAYDTQSIGKAKYGDLDNLIWSAQVFYRVGPHAFSVGYQKVSGEGDYTYGIDGGSNYWFGNSIQYSDFDYEDEKSWQLRYDYDFSAMGVPGLGFMTRYVKGSDFKDGKGNDIDGAAWERDAEFRYIVQSGPAKNLSFALRQASYRSSERGGQLDEVRLITNYTFNIF